MLPKDINGFQLPEDKKVRVKLLENNIRDWEAKQKKVTEGAYPIRTIKQTIDYLLFKE